MKRFLLLGLSAAFAVGATSLSLSPSDPLSLQSAVDSGADTILLAPGIYEYKFVINGVWTLDPDPDRDWTQNGLGTLNSVLRVG